MAAGGFKEFVAGETLDQDEINDFLMQGMLVFAGTAARGSAIGTPVEGQFSFLADTDTVEFYDGAAWTPFSTGPGVAVIGSTTGSPTIGTVTTGGTTYVHYTFTGNGSLIVDSEGLVDVAIVAGGGSGGVRNSTDFEPGGGGGGGVLEKSVLLAEGTAVVTVGAGASGVSPDANGNPGTNSSVGSFISYGGGAGAFVGADALGSGGTGGGVANVGTRNVPAFGQYDGTVIGFEGGHGNGSNGGTNGGGGGGGAGAVGQDGTGSVGGDGGAGKTINLTGSSATYGGGGGGRRSSGSSGSGGAGGGTSASGAGTSASAAANTGGGSGGGRTGSGNGGSGIVIVRVAV